MHRRPTTQDITWLLDLHNNKQLDLNPPIDPRPSKAERVLQFSGDGIDLRCMRPLRALRIQIAL